MTENLFGNSDSYGNPEPLFGELSPLPDTSPQQIEHPGRLRGIAARLAEVAKSPEARQAVESVGRAALRGAAAEAGVTKKDGRVSMWRVARKSAGVAYNPLDKTPRKVIHGAIKGAKSEISGQVREAAVRKGAELLRGYSEAPSLPQVELPSTSPSDEWGSWDAPTTTPRLPSPNGTDNWGAVDWDAPATPRK